MKIFAAVLVVQWLHFIINVLSFDNDWIRPFQVDAEGFSENVAVTK